MRFPIRHQFMLPLLAVALASLTALAIINAQLATSQTHQRIETQLRSVVSVLAESSFPLTDAVLEQMGGLANSEFVLTDPEGREIASSLSERVGNIPVESEPQGLNEVELGPETRIGSQLYFHSSVWVQRRSRSEVHNILHILFPQDEYNAAWRHAFVPPLVIGIAAIVLAVVVTQIVASRLGKEFRRLGQEVERLAEGNFGDVTLSRWDDETRDLAAAVNKTALRLAEYEAEVRRTEQIRTTALLGAGLAHEMRNAATGCRLAIDLHNESCPGELDDDTLQVAKRQLQLMESRLQRYLQLGGKSQVSEAKDFDLGQLLDELIALIAPAARHADVTLHWQNPCESFVVHGDPEMLGLAVINILQNALDAAAKGQAASDISASIHVDLLKLESGMQLIVSDSGEGIAPEVVDSVFEPFASDKAEGVGLGLAVAREVVESAGGRLGWDRVDNLTHFRICLPLVKAGVEHV